MNDGSPYPSILQRLRGKAFGWGFEKKIVLMGELNFKEHYAEINGYKWNLTELIAHEAVHCYQFNKFGLLHSNPIANIPLWKWEGYPEYVARKSKCGLALNIAHLLSVEKTDNDDWIDFDDSTGTVLTYYRNWLLVQYCLDVKKMTYTQLLRDKTAEAELEQEMMNWYKTNH